MKPHTSIIAALAGLLTLAASPTANAFHYQLRAKIPFAFTVNTITLPAGSYLVERLDGSEGIFLMRGARHGFFLASHGVMSGDPALGARVVFNRYGDRYFLRELWVGRRGYPVPETTEERDLAKAQERKVALLRVVVPIGEG
jgi:hypothetical protein